MQEIEFTDHKVLAACKQGGVVGAAIVRSSLNHDGNRFAGCILVRLGSCLCLPSGKQAADNYKTQYQYSKYLFHKISF